MNGTPRLRSAFPGETPHSRRSVAQRTSAAFQDGIRKPRLAPAQEVPSDNSPRISLEIIDAATQRLIAVSFWAALWAWKLKDFWMLTQSDDNESFGLFMKWVLFDGAFLFGLPELRIPWMEWSSTLMTVLFLGHVLLDAMLMFGIGLPIAFWMEWVVRLFYDREIAVSERKVKAQQYIDPSSLIQGKHIINILPEGSAILNPQNEFFCIGGDISQVNLPLQINQTQPISIELLRRDFEGDDSEVITIGAKAARNLRKAAIDKHKRSSGHPTATEALVLQYHVKKPGQYTIKKIVDESNLEVRPRPSEVVVVSCPTAKITIGNANRCKGDLSDLAFEVTGTPPLKMKYRKLVNGNPTLHNFQSIQPPDFVSPYTRQQQLTLARATQLDVSWARSQKVSVPVNETMITLGRYSFFINEIEDAFGNRVTYFDTPDDDQSTSSKHPEVSQFVTVYDRPSIRIRENECTKVHPVKVAAGQDVNLPFIIASSGQEFDDLRRGVNKYDFAGEHVVEYSFLPESEIGSDTAGVPVDQKIKLKRPGDNVSVRLPGLYTFKSIASQHCQGEVSGSAQCAIENPPKPTVQISATEVTHRCAKSPVGLDVRLDFEGTPPFDIVYKVDKVPGRGTEVRTKRFDTRRGTLPLTPDYAGAYTYTFQELRDKYYTAQSIKEVLKQDVKPSANAMFDTLQVNQEKNVCQGETVEFDVRLQGEAPWTVEYDIIHGKIKKRTVASDLTDDTFKIVVSDFKEGGAYTIALASIIDKSGCKEDITDEAKFNVWDEKPTIAFGKIDGQYYTQILEGKKIKVPVKLTGQPSFSYSLIHVESQKTQTLYMHETAGFTTIDQPGNYALDGVHDKHCMGDPVAGASEFSVSWIGRPSVSIAQHPTVEQKSGKYIKADICEGDDDSVDVALEGLPPFTVKYEEHAKPDEGQKSLRQREIQPALRTASIQLDTAKAGQYEYRFHEVSDANYNADPKRKNVAILQQTVTPRPSARFHNPGTTYSFCSTDGSTDEIIPIKLIGTPPFSIDIDIRYSGSAAPESITREDINSNSYDLRLPRRHLKSGTSHLTLRRVRDGRGCQSKTETTVAPSRVHIAVHDPPSIVAVEPREDYCVGERVSFSLTGVPPFTVFYTFGGEKRKATEKSTTFTRFNAAPGSFIITAISDSSSKCTFTTTLQKTVHALPGVRVSQGSVSHVDIHEGGESDVVFNLSGEPPFELTYTRSEYARKGRRGQVLETKTERTEERTLRVKESEGGEYEPISVRDRWCLTSKSGAAQGKKGQKLLTN